MQSSKSEPQIGKSVPYRPKQKNVATVLETLHATWKFAKKDPEMVEMPIFFGHSDDSPTVYNIVTCGVKDSLFDPKYSITVKTDPESKDTTDTDAVLKTAFFMDECAILYKMEPNHIPYIVVASNGDELTYTIFKQQLKEKRAAPYPFSIDVRGIAVDRIYGPMTIPWLPDDPRSTNATKITTALVDAYFSDEVDKAYVVADKTALTMLLFFALENSSTKYRFTSSVIMSQENQNRIFMLLTRYLDKKRSPGDN